MIKQLYAIGLGYLRGFWDDSIKKRIRYIAVNNVKSKERKGGEKVEEVRGRQDKGSCTRLGRVRNSHMLPFNLSIYIVSSELEI